MSDLKHRKSAVVDVPGLAYFFVEAEKPVKAAPAPQPASLTALEQMYGYFEG
jgi:hypothetical protein